MGKIHILDNKLVNKIAAGEVIERPASVVKELIENSLDAGAKKILIETKEGGKSYIRVTDDGEGMSEEDAVLSIKEHATSKIRETDDLFNISTFGFRGEALSSIASVSIMVIKTKTSDSEIGIEIFSEFSEVKKTKQIVCNRGTTIIVEDLFSNIPARKKHQKSIQVELSYIVDIVSRYALSNPQVYFQLINNGKSLINSPITEDISGRIASVYGWKMMKSLLPVSYSSEGIIISGFTSKPEFTRGNKAWQSIFVNKRYVKNRLINDAVYDSYHTFLNVGKHPVFILLIQIDPQKIDVNVHPTKREIRLSDEAKVHQAVIDAVKSTLLSVELIPDGKAPEKKLNNTHIDNISFDQEKQSTFSTYEGISKSVIKEDPTWENRDAGYSYESDNHNIQDVDVGFSSKESLYSPAKTIVSSETKQKLRIVGQILGCYIIIEKENSFFLVDQHAAHERVMYEKFMEEYNGKGVAVQELIGTTIIDLSPEEVIVVDDNLHLLSKLGFKLERFGRNSFIIRTVPVIFGRHQNLNILHKIIPELKEGFTMTLDSVKEERIIRKSCIAAVKANDRLEHSEMTKLIGELFAAKSPYTCPHGRPTMIIFSQADIEKMFKRRL
jgi:DNA mismatch repair protein MutL